MARFRYDSNRVHVTRETYIGSDGEEWGRWVVRYDDGTLFAYAMTWWGAWRLACHAVGWKVPQ